jgi:hypothetical protein
MGVQEVEPAGQSPAADLVVAVRDPLKHGAPVLLRDPRPVVVCWPLECGFFVVVTRGWPAGFPRGLHGDHQGSRPSLSPPPFCVPVLVCAFAEQHWSDLHVGLLVGLCVWICTGYASSVSRAHL